MSHSFTSRGARETEGVKAQEHPRAPGGPISPVHLVWSGRELAPHPHHPARTQSLAQSGPASPTQERLLDPSWKPGSHWQRKEPGKFTQRCWQ